MLVLILKILHRLFFGGILRGLANKLHDAFLEVFVFLVLIRWIVFYKKSVGITLLGLSNAFLKSEEQIMFKLKIMEYVTVNLL